MGWPVLDAGIFLHHKIIIMDTQDQKKDYNQPGNSGRIWGGLFLLFLGGIFLLRETSYFFFPYWLFTWPMILIVIGVFIGLKHGFRGPGWLILLVIGSIFLADQIDTGIDLHRFMIPAIIIAVGLTMILRPKRYRRNRDWDKWGGRRRWNNWDNYQQPPPVNTPLQPAPDTGTQTQNTFSEDHIDCNAVFGSVQKIVVSKNFKGGEITCFMGGAEIDLSQADITGSVVLEVTTVMGGAKLIVPPNWEVKSEVTTFFGGMEDKRQVRGNVVDFNKVLVLRGTAFMGGIELKSF
jgi:predicted membrane protein